MLVRKWLARLSDRTWFVLFSLAALAVRLPYLNLIPYFEDETLEVVTALKVWPGGQLIAVAWDNYIGPVMQYLWAGLFAAFGPDLNLARGVVLITGALTVGATYALARTLNLSKFAAFIAALLLLANPPHILINSHIAWSNSAASLFTTLVLLTLALAVKRGQPRWLIASGVLAGVSMQFHPVSILILIGVVVWFIADGDARKLLRTKWPYFAGILAVVCYSNVIVSNLQSGFYGVAEAQSRSYIWQLSSSVEVYVQNVGRLILQLFRSTAGDLSEVETWQALIGWPLIYVAWLIGGVIYAVRSRLKMPLWIVGTLIVFMPLISNHYGTLITTRLTNQFLPLLFVMMGAAGAAIIDWVKRRDVVRGAYSVMAAMFIVSAVLPLGPLFGYYQQRLEQGRTNAEFAPFVEVLKKQANGAPIYLSATVSELRLGGSGNVNYVLDTMLSLAQVPHDTLSPARILEYLIAKPGRSLLVLQDKDLDGLRPYIPFQRVSTPVDAATSKRGYGLYEVAADACVTKPDFVRSAAMIFPQHVLSANFENKLELWGYDLAATDYRVGAQIRVTVYWRALSHLDYIYTGFAHLIGSINPATNNPLWGQDDHELGRGLYRTLIWQPGEVIVEEYTLTVEANTPNGSYQLAIGAYDPNFVRLKQIDSTGATIDDKVVLQTIRVAH
ncbi:MAG: glycosyltransferase family 39 protein [Thermoflexales bacterium]|nr:glycosyltransferase family 39 protein [Thermoflexales bacterium]